MIRIRRTPRQSAGQVGFKGRLSVRSVRPDGTVRDERHGDNVMCTTGLTVIAASLVWSGIQDQAANQGLTTATYLTPLYGAVGNGTGVVDPSDTILFNELGRQIVGAGAAGPATASIDAEITWLFYFPQPTIAINVTEAGVFANAGVSSGQGALMDHWLFSPALAVPTTDTLILQASFSLAGM